MAQSDKRKLLLAIYILVAIYLLPMFPHGGSANELTRWATAASLFEKGSFDIKWTEDLIGPNVDSAAVGGNTYSNKAPGTAILGVPFYAAARIFTGPPDASNIRVTWFVMRFALSSLPLILLAFWLYRNDADEFALGSLLFATPLFIYSLLFFSHVFVAIVLYFAYRLLYDGRGLVFSRYLWAGMLCGLAVISEFPAVFAVVVFGAGLLFTEKRDRYRRLIYFLAGGAPFVAFLLIYNNTLFGSPFSMSYAHESFPEWAEVAGQGVFGIGIPSVSNFYLLLLSPARGLLFYSPILVLSFVLFFKSRESKTLRHKVKLWTVGICILILCGHGAAHGGWAFGARYLVFILPLLLDSFFDGETYDMSNVWQGFLFGVSFLLCTLPVLTFPFAPPEFTFPHSDLWRPFLIDGWYTPNLANVLGLRGILTLLPIVPALAAAIFIVRQGMRRPRRFAYGLASAVLLVTFYVFLPGLDNDEARLRRATIEERYFLPASRLEFERSAALAKKDWKTIGRINDYEWNIAHARAYAPDDFPYLETRDFAPSPVMIVKQSIHLQQQGRMGEAEELLKNGKASSPIGTCEFSTSLGEIYYTTGRKDQALTELESIQPMASRGSRPDCLRSQFLLGSLYSELGRDDDATRVLTAFMASSEGTMDEELLNFRQQIQRK